MWHLLAGPSPDPNPWAQLGIASIVCALLFAIAWTLWRKLQDVQAEKDKLFEERIAREQFLSDRVAPLLAEAVSILASAPARFETALSQAHQSTQSSDLDRLVDKLQNLTRDLKP